MNLGLSEKVALVTAASRGLGRAIAEELADEGASLAICARSERALDQARDEISSRSGREVLALTADVAVMADVERVVSATIERYGRVDILVTNSGGPPSGRFETLTREAWDAAVAVTLYSVVDFVRLV